MWKRLIGRLQIFQPKKPAIHRIPRFINEEHLLTQTNRGWYIGNRRLSEEERAALRAEAKDFGGSFLWKLMRNDVHYIAYLQSTNKRRTEEDALYGGAMYKNLEILERFIENCKAL